MSAGNQQNKESVLRERNSLENSETLSSMLNNQTQFDAKVIKNIYYCYKCRSIQPTDLEKSYINEFVRRVQDYLDHKRSVFLKNGKVKVDGPTLLCEDEKKILNVLKLVLHMDHLGELEDISKFGNLLQIKDNQEDCSGELSPKYFWVHYAY